MTALSCPSNLVAAAVLELPAIQRLPALVPLVQRAAAGRPRAWELPGLVAAALGLAPPDVKFAAAALACTQIAIVLVDDLLDQDPRGVHHALGVGPTANYALALQAAAVESLARALGDTERQAHALRTLAEVTSRVALGQDLDARPVTGEATYWRIVSEKSAAFFGLAFYLGAIPSSAPLEMGHALDQLGALYGEMVQIYDDLRDILEVPASPDWLQARAPLPILYASLVPHPERDDFNALRQRLAGAGSSADDLAAAQLILKRSGAVSYSLDQILSRELRARTLLASLKLPDPEPLDALLDEIARPARTWLNPVVAP